MKTQDLWYTRVLYKNTVVHALSYFVENAFVIEKINIEQQIKQHMTTFCLREVIFEVAEV